MYLCYSKPCPNVTVIPTTQHGITNQLASYKLHADLLPLHYNIYLACQGRSLLRGLGQLIQCKE